MSLTKFTNCRILRDHKIITEDLWVRYGHIVDPEKVFFDEQKTADMTIDCNNLIIAPGFIDIQINGGFGIDFAHNLEDIEGGIEVVAQGILAHGVTAFCPTIVTSSPETYAHLIPKIDKKLGSCFGAGVLGIHLEGPFISLEKKGAHKPEFIREFSGGFGELASVYGTLRNVSIVTLAPELEDSMEIISQLVKRKIVVSLGHTTSNLPKAEEAVRNGATCITHLFNAMPNFHHRDPGLVGLLTSRKIPKPVFFGIISDGIHTHPAALRIAYRTHPDGLVLVTDAISALGLSEGKHHIGELEIEIRERKAFIANTDTLCGSIANMNECVQKFYKHTGCSQEYALEAASLHPAQVLGIQQNKGTLDYGSHADFVMLDDNLLVQSTWIAGSKVYSREDTKEW